MKTERSIDDQILDRLMEKLKADEQISADVIAQLEKLRRQGQLNETEKVLRAYHQEAASHDHN